MCFSPMALLTDRKNTLYAAIKAFITFYCVIILRLKHDTHFYVVYKTVMF